MAAPNITLVNSNNQTITNWDCGIVQANNYSAILALQIWNNKNGQTALSDLKNATTTPRSRCASTPRTAR